MPGVSARAARAWLAATLLIGGMYLGFYLNRMWYPHDEGALGQTAERVLAGEVPHRDFDEPYTGLLTYMHAAAFAVLGIRLPVLRIPLFIMTMLWMVAVFRIAVRSTGPPGAAAVTLVALAWSVPNYPASMPSWYNLFFATFAAAALLRWDETRLSRWLMLAGMAGGISFLFKLSGLFVIAGAGLYLLYATRAEPSRPSVPGVRSSPDRGSWWPAALISLACLLLVVLLWRSIAPFYLLRVVYHFVLPGGAIALALAAREWIPPIPPAGSRVRSLAGAAAPFLAGAILPVLVFVIGYGLAGGVPALLHGVFVAPFRRLAFANMRPPAEYWTLAAAPLAILLRPRSDPAAPRWRKAGVVVGLLFAALLGFAYVESFPHRFVWQSLRGLIPLVAVVAAVVMTWPRLTQAWNPGGERRFVLLATIAAFASLIQFPFTSPIYFLYVAPLLLLALVALVQGIGKTPPPLAGATLAFYGLFAVLLVTPGATENLGFSTVAQHETLRLDLPRAGLRVKRNEVELYAALIPELQARAGTGAIWAGPDAPEVYFLGGFRNRSRAIFDFLAADAGPPITLLRRLDGVRVVAINLTPLFSPALPAELLDSLRVRFPEGHQVGHFELRWRP
ncbi:MAG TPA: glycosyltransferase family 39 protein [Gemmatimonadales bacterium]|nr:glycosyltransferase family 39 protein [Gemmatimonadales bacterium]